MLQKNLRIDRTWAQDILWILLGMIVLLATNQWYSPQEGIDLVFATDSRAYYSFAENAPNWVPGEAGFGHAYRWFFPYVIGVVSHWVGISVYSGFLAAVILSTFLILFLIQRQLREWNLGILERSFCLSLILFNPYTFRYYLSVPGMGTDLYFNLGLTWTLVSFFRKNFLGTAAGMGVALLARQNGILLFPALAMGYFILPGYREESLRSKGLKILVLGVLAFTLYRGLSTVAAYLAQGSSLSSAFAWGLFIWLFDFFTGGTHYLESYLPGFAPDRPVPPEGPPLRDLAVFLLRWFFPSFFVLAFCFSRNLRKIWAALKHDPFSQMAVIFVFFTGVQSLIAGPYVGLSVVRLSQLMLVPGVFFVALQLKAEPLPKHRLAVTFGGALIFFGSLQHMTSSIGARFWPNTDSFGALYVGSVLGMLILLKVFGGQKA